MMTISVIVGSTRQNRFSEKPAQGIHQELQKRQAIAARLLDRAGVELRPGENIQFIITDAHSKLLDDRVRAWTLWEAWRGYDVGAYKEALEKGFQPFTHFAPSLASASEPSRFLEDLRLVRRPVRRS